MRKSFNKFNIISEKGTVNEQNCIQYGFEKSFPTEPQSRPLSKRSITALALCSGGSWSCRVPAVPSKRDNDYYAYIPEVNMHIMSTDAFNWKTPYNELMC